MGLDGDDVVRIEPARVDPELPVEPGFLAEDGPPPLDDPDSPAHPAPDPAAVAAATAVLAEKIVARLNPEQARAVTTTEGPLLILAGAGSGKTRVLAHRVAYLIGVKGVRPWQILAVTFTNRAAGELRERIMALVGERRPGRPGRDVPRGVRSRPAPRRRGHRDRPRFVIYDTDDQQTLMKQILREEDLPATGEFRPSAVLGAISRAKNEMLDADALEEVAVNHHERMVARLARAYQERLRAVGALDFDDLLLEAVRLFQEAPEVLARYQDRWRYLHVDEYQDTNRPSTCGSGRSPSATATWPWSATTTSRSTRGAARTCATSSTSSATSPNATVVKLEQNYRSTQLILDAAHAVVVATTRRARTRSSGPRTPAAARSSASRRTTRRRRPSGSPARSRR